MAVEDRARSALYARLAEVLGDDHAMTLIGSLPPAGREPATREDAARLGERMEGLETRMDGLETRMDRLERQVERVHDRLDDFHHALREQSRTFMFATLSSVVTVGGLAFGAATLI